MIQLAACLSRHLPLLRESRADGELLAAFLAHRDEEAFAELVRRHGPLVWAACRRLLPDSADAEDAFQSSFLVLVRRARRLTGRDAIGPWLYQVAVWTARNIRRRNARIMAKRKPLADVGASSNAVEVRTDLDAALAALPEKYRTPLVMCHLQGWSRRVAAARLGCPEGTLSSLLARGLDRLRAKLAGFDPKLLGVAPAVPLLLATSTVKAALVAPASAAVHQLIEGVVRMFWIKKATAASVALLAVFGFGMGIGVSVQQVPGATAGDETVQVAAADELAGRVALTSAEENVFQFTQRLARLKAEGGAPALITHAESLLAEAQEQLEEVRKQQRVRAVKALLQTRASDRGLEKLKAELEALNERLKMFEVLARRYAAAALAAKAKGDLLGEQQAIVAGDAARRERDEILASIKTLEVQIERLTLDLKDERTREQRELEAQIEKLKAEQEQLQTQAYRLARQRVQFEKQLAELEAKRAANKVPPVAAANAASLDITITKDALWPFKVVEVGADGKPVGTVSFDNIEVLSRYLTRTGKDATGPKAVRLTAQPDTKYEVVKKILDACAAAGFKPPTMVSAGGGFKLKIPTLGERTADDAKATEENKAIFKWYLEHMAK